MFTSALLLAASMVVGQAGERMPTELQYQIDKHLIGEWTLKFSWGAESGIGEYSARWSSGKQSVIIRSWSQDKNGRFELTELLGWDPRAKELLSLTFSSRGEHGYLHWQKWSKDKWTGRGTGWWDGKDWDSPITVEWKNNEFRYEDISDGQPLVIVYTRKK